MELLKYYIDLPQKHLQVNVFHQLLKLIISICIEKHGIGEARKHNVINSKELHYLSLCVPF